jgi:hypothetical protein
LTHKQEREKAETKERGRSGNESTTEKDEFLCLMKLTNTFSKRIEKTSAKI